MSRFFSSESWLIAKKEIFCPLTARIFPESGNLLTFWIPFLYLIKPMKRQTGTILYRVVLLHCLSVIKVTNAINNSRVFWWKIFYMVDAFHSANSLLLIWLCFFYSFSLSLFSSFFCHGPSSTFDFFYLLFRHNKF